MNVHTWKDDSGAFYAKPADESQERDLWLFITGNFVALANDWQCHSVIVANDGALRHYHNCCDELEHTDPHECGCGVKWWFTGDEATPETCFYSGPLTKVTFAAHNTDPRPGWEVYGGTEVKE